MFFDLETLKVKGLALLGFGFPAFNDWTLKDLDPILDLLIKLGQIGVAVYAILYTHSKWSATRKGGRRKRK